MFNSLAACALALAALLSTFLGSSGSVGSALRTGYATYCAPTPTRCQDWGGDAKLGAVHSFSFGDAPYGARVCRLDDPSTCVTVTVVSFCGCGDRHGLETVIDLSPSAMRQLAANYKTLGILKVSVESPVDRPAPTLPPTDTE